MTWRNVLSISVIAAGLVGWSVAVPAQNAQQPPPARPAQPAQAPAPKAMKDQLVGTWTLLVSDYVNPDKTQTPQFGPNPMGILVLEPNGHYSTQIMRASRPKIAANDRTKGTADENKAAMTGMFSHFGTWTVDEPSKTLTFHIEGSSYPNWDGTTQKRTITSLTFGDELSYTVATPAAGTLPVTLAWKYVK
jgi:hypothetical protein